MYRMKLLHRKHVAALLLIIATMIAVIGFIIHNNNEPQNDSVLYTPKGPEHQYILVSGTVEQVSVDDLFKQSSLAVVGKVTGKSESFQVSHATANAIQNYTDYYIEPTETIRGKSEYKTITVRIEGGTAGNITQNFTESPELIEGEEYLFFLCRPGRGGAFNTEGDYYYVLGLKQGIFSKDASGDYYSQDDTKLARSYTMRNANVFPIVEDYFRTEFIENQKLSLKYGFITQDEYDNMMKSIDVYATIVK